MANEFFDALPVHKFVRVKCDNETEQRRVETGDRVETEATIWREVLVDIYDDLAGETKLRLVRSRHRTPGMPYNSFKTIHCLYNNVRAISSPANKVQQKGDILNGFSS